MSKQSGNEILDLENDLEQAKSRYLRSHGWKYTSSTPGCIWLWVKKTPIGETIMVDTGLALSMQRHSCSIRGNEW